MFANVTFRAKLLGVVATPVVVMSGLGWLVVSPRLAEASSAADTLRESELVESSLRVVADVADEREQSVAVLAGRGDDGQLTDARVRVDRSLGTLGTSSGAPQGPVLSSGVTDALDASRRIASLRRAVDDESISAAEAFEGYTSISERLARLGSGVSAGSGSAELIRRSQSLDLFVQALDRTTELRGDVAMRLGAGTFDDVARGRAAALREQADRLLAQFESTAIPADRERYREAMATTDVVAGTAAIDQVLGGTAGFSGVGPEAWSDAMTERVAAITGVQSHISAGLRGAAATAAHEARSTAWWTMAMTLAAAALSVLASGMLSRSMSRRLGHISAQAADIASNQLPAALAVTRQGAEQDIAEHLPLVETDGTDEVGQLAESFNQVLASSVTSSLEHARHQQHVLTNLLTSLGRRNQSIIERQLEIIDELESGYSDPELLSRLFRLDHLTTGLRRNAENLLVLAADVAPRTWREAVPVYDVVRSAASEVDDLERVEIFVDTDGVPAVQGRAAVDLSHLLAELIDNAAAFSPPGTSVVVTGRTLAEGFELTVADQGIGMAPEELADVNRRLASPSGLDQIVADRVGFQVVARLAARLGATVALAPRDRRGLVATVHVPVAVLEGVGTWSDEDAGTSGAVVVGPGDGAFLSPLDAMAFELDAPVLPTAALAPSASIAPVAGRRADDESVVPASVGAGPAPTAELLAFEEPASPSEVESGTEAFRPIRPASEVHAALPIRTVEESVADAAVEESVVAVFAAESVVEEPVVAEPVAVFAEEPVVAESVAVFAAEPVVEEPVVEERVVEEPVVSRSVGVPAGLARREPGRALDETFGGAAGRSTAFARLPVPVGADETPEDDVAAQRRQALSRHSTGVARGRSLFVRQAAAPEPSWPSLEGAIEEVHS